MTAAIRLIEDAFRAIPLPVLDAWGRAAYLVGILLAVAAFGGFTFRPGGRWGVGRERQSWDDKALLSIPLTFIAIFVTGFVGSGIVLVPGAQTFESLKDLSVLLCLVLFGYPALLAVPPAYMLSDLIEGVPPDFLLDWLPGYFINPSCFWVAYQLIGKDPDFRKARTFRRYLGVVAFFMSVEPQLWGYICSGKFTPEISYRNITPALFFTTFVTWAVAPLTMLAALPLARKYGLFWADVPGRVRERVIGQERWIWESGREGAAREAVMSPQGLPLRLFLVVPFIGLVLLMAGTAATVALNRGRDAAEALAGRLQREISDTILLRLDDLAGLGPASTEAITGVLNGAQVAERGRAFVLDHRGGLVASSSGGAGLSVASESADPVIRGAAHALKEAAAGTAVLREAAQFRFDVISERPLSKETWLARATPYTHGRGSADRVLVVAMAESDYLDDVREGRSQSAVVISVGLILALLAAPLLGGAVAAPILRVARSAQAIARGDLSQRVEPSRLEELGVFAESFNHMAEQLQESRLALDADIERRKQVESALRESEERLEELVARRTQALTAANKELEAFSHSVSHDLRAPLRAMNGYAKILMEDYGARLDDEGRGHLENIQKVAATMAELIRGLLNLSRMSHCELKVEPVDLSWLAEEVLRDLRTADPERTVDVRIAPGLSARADAIMLRQVLQNLLGNAWKFTSRVPGARIEFDRAVVDGQDTFRITDNGAGFNMSYAPRLFQPFQRLHHVEDFEGTGVGLAIVERIISRHGGRVWAEGAVDRGAIVYFTLP
jgi:two-component system, sensor histidine kinase and response regulator